MLVVHGPSVRVMLLHLGPLQCPRALPTSLNSMRRVASLLRIIDSCFVLLSVFIIMICMQASIVGLPKQVLIDQAAKLQVVRDGHRTYVR